MSGENLLHRLFVALSIGMLVGASAAAQPASQNTPDDANLRTDLETLRSVWSGGRYRIEPGDVLDIDFPYVPEFDQTVSVQPDGFVSLRGTNDVPIGGLTVQETREAVVNAYASILKDPVASVILKEFDKPSFVATGEVARPGRYELRGATTLSQALALAGGPTAAAKKSAIVLFRRVGNDLTDVKVVDLQKMFAKRNLSEDPILRPGDTLFVPKSGMSKISPFIPKPGIGLFGNPF